AITGEVLEILIRDEHDIGQACSLALRQPQFNGFGKDPAQTLLANEETNQEVEQVYNFSMADQRRHERNYLSINPFAPVQVGRPVPGSPLVVAESQRDRACGWFAVGSGHADTRLV